MLTGSMWLVFCWIIFYNVVHPSVMGKPTFTIPSLASLTGFAGFGTGNAKNNNENTGKNADHRNDHIEDRVKPYSGLRVRNDSIRMVYYHDQTIAVAEIGPGKLLLNCELIEVIEPEDAAQTLRKLSTISRPLTVTLDEMLTLMKQCEMIEESTMKFINKNASHSKGNGSRNNDKNNANAIPNAPRGGGLLAGLGSFSLFSGIVPGTKWCGTGDIAENYHDLGPDAKVDRCCRTHDICPVKISSSSQRYNLSNPSIVTKSYCKCDDMLYECLKESNSTTGEILGNIYFNIVQVPCIEDIKGKRHFRKSRNNF